jgi:hypothetical protein
MFMVTKLEIKRNIHKWSIACLLIFFALLIIINQVGIVRYRVDQKQSQEFIKFRVKLLESFINYEQYGIYGIDRVLLGCHLVSLFYNSSTLNDLKANVEMSARYKLYRPEMGINLFKKPTGGNLDFSWFFLIFGSAMVTIWAFFAHRNREYLMFLNNFASTRRIYAGIIMGRIVLIFSAILLLLLMVWLQYMINGIGLTAGEIYGLCYFFLVSAMTMSVLMAVNCIFGAIQN